MRSRYSDKSRRETLLHQGQKQLGLAIPLARQALMLDYLSLLARWNQVHNLTAVTDPDEMVTHHLLDCLSIYPFINGVRVLDIGTGGGLPGVPLAIIDPKLELTLVDGRGKKIEFLRYVKSKLALKNIIPISSRIENFRPAEKFDTLVTRAVATVPTLLSLTAHVFVKPSRFVFMKGAVEEAMNTAELAADWKISHQQIVVPYLDAQRHLVIIENRA